MLEVGEYVIKADLIDVLSAMNVRRPDLIREAKLKGDNISLCCPIHGEKNPSCNIYVGDDPNKPYGHVHCFACGYSAPFRKFVADAFGVSQGLADSWLIKNFGERFDSSQKLLLGLSEKIQLNHETSVRKRQLNQSGMLDYHAYLAKRRISKATCERFGVKYDPSDNSIVFPVWDEKGNYVMSTRRSVDKKAFYIEKDIEKPVYLLNFVDVTKPVYIVESQFNALSLWDWGRQAVALFGTGTSEQIGILNKSGILRFVICLDNDEAGHKGTKRLMTGLRSDLFVDTLTVPVGKDVNDLTKEEFEKLEEAQLGSYNIINL